MGVSEIVVPQNGWFIMEKPIKMDDLGVPLSLETPIYPKKKPFLHCSTTFLHLETFLIMKSEGKLSST